MITPAVQPPQPHTRLAAKVNATDFAALLAAVATSGVLPADLGNGKTLADVTQLTLFALPAPHPDGTVAMINATIK